MMNLLCYSSVYTDISVISVYVRWIYKGLMENKYEITESKKQVTLFICESLHSPSLSSTFSLTHLSSSISFLYPYKSNFPSQFPLITSLAIYYIKYLLPWILEPVWYKKMFFCFHFMFSVFTNNYKSSTLFPLSFLFSNIYIRNSENNFLLFLLFFI